jgi:hypothetical protein
VGSAAVNALAERLDIERTAMGKMLGFLERDGLTSSDGVGVDGGPGSAIGLKAIVFFRLRQKRNGHAFNSTDGRTWPWMPRKIKWVGPKNAAPGSDRTRAAANRRGTSASPRQLVPFASRSGFIRGIPTSKLLQLSGVSI